MKLRGAISGFGEVAARAHLSGWLTRDDVSIRAVHEPIAERRHEAIRLIRNVRVYEDLELMLDGEALDFVDIASPPAMHAPAARLALKAGAHVLVEKPLCLSLAEFDELAALAAGSGRVLMCVHNWKHAPSYALARDLLDRGRIGTVRSLSIERLRTAPAGAGGAGGRWRSSGATGGGILVDHGWHVFYLMQWLMGEAPCAISAILASNQEGVEEVADLRVSFGSGRFASALLSWRAEARKTSATIVGDTGTIEVGNERIVVIVRVEWKRWPSTTFPTTRTTPRGSLEWRLSSGMLSPTATTRGSHGRISMKRAMPLRLSSQPANPQKTVELQRRSSPDRRSGRSEARI